MSSDPTPKSRSWKPRLRTILLIVNVIVLLIPLAGIGLLRIYETELIRRTEAELISQGALVQAVYRDRVLDAIREGCDPSVTTATYGQPVQVQWPVNVGDKFKPVPAELNMSTEAIRPPAPDARDAAQPPDDCAWIAGQDMTTVLLDSQQITLSGTYIVDYNGVIVGTTQRPHGKSLAHREEVARALNGEFVQVVRERVTDEEAPPLDSLKRGTNLRVNVAMPIVHNNRVLGAVMLVRTPISLAKAVYKNRYLFAGFLGIIFLAAIIISLLTALTISRPIRDLIEQTRRIARREEDATEPIENPGTFEIEQLSHAFADMASSLQERAEYIETFARNVSHEFKTPLSSIRGTVELLQDHLDEMDEEERQRFLEMLDKDSERMQRLVTRLLDLARADVVQPTGSGTDLGEVLDSCVEPYRDKLDIELELAEGVGAVAMDRETLETVLSNLFENANRYGGDEVRVEASRVEDEVVFVVQDNGPGISEGNAQKIFESFFTTARDEGGTGLGLAIVRSLIRSHDGEIRLLDSDEGAAFEVRLPGV
ncbi:MAG: HAMP domain-containing sensor histidine kinase [Myxococcota bacterium]